MELPAQPYRMAGAQRRQSGRKILLFLGRLHPKKGLVNALRAWKQALHSTSNIKNSKFNEWQFVIAGWDQGGHEAELKRLCDELGLAWADVPAANLVGETPTLLESSSVQSVKSVVKNSSSVSVIFTGPAFGDAKDALLRQADAFILPSFSEGLPMSVLEAWSYRLPVLMTDHCNLPEGFAAEAAIRIGTDVESITEGMRSLFQSQTSDLRSLGANGRALVERQFTWPQVAAQMKEVYEWVLGGGEKPSSVVL
jgi:poly(glycerol-phosphate) alpha-glucosyltransferase